MVILTEIIDDFKTKLRSIAYIKVELLSIHNFSSFERFRTKIFKNLNDLDLLINQCASFCEKLFSDSEQLVSNSNKFNQAPIEENLSKQNKSNYSCSADFRKEYSPLVFYDDLKLNYSYNSDKAESINNILVAPKSTDGRNEEINIDYKNRYNEHDTKQNKCECFNTLKLQYDYKDKIGKPSHNNISKNIDLLTDSRNKETLDKQEKSNLISELIISITKDQELSQFLLNSNPLIIEDLIKPEASEEFIEEVNNKIMNFYQGKPAVNSIMYTSPIANRNKINSDGNNQYHQEKLNKTSASILSKKSSNKKHKINNSYSLSKEKFNNFTKKHPSYFDRAYQYGGKSLSIINYPTKEN